MKTKIILPLFLILLIFSCKTAQNQVQIRECEDTLSLQTTEQGKITEFYLSKGSSYNHPTFVIWIEDMEGNFVKTVFITKSYASGIFGHQMISDSVWKQTPGQSYQPAALPYWTTKKGLINGKTLVPTPENPYIDAYTGATPTSNFSYKTITNNAKKFRILIEVNQTWDWNSFWTNAKYPENAAYKHSAQPSLIYAATIDGSQKEYFLNPIGHGDPTGETGLLFTDISTLTTAKDIFKSIKVVIE